MNTPDFVLPPFTVIMETSDDRVHSPFRRLRNSMSRHSNTVRLATLCSILNKLWDLAPPLLIGVAVDVVVEREESLMAGIGIIDPWHQLVILSIATFVIWGLESIFEYLYGILSVSYTHLTLPTILRV